MRDYKNSEQGAFAAASDSGYQQGLTKREYFAAMAMQAMIASGCSIDIDKERPFQTRAETAIMMADEVLRQLEK